jgi:thymidine kinase
MKIFCLFLLNKTRVLSPTLTMYTLKEDVKLRLIIGPMFAGKTSALFSWLDLYRNAGFTTLYVNSTLDDRSQFTAHSTHSTVLKTGDTPCIKVRSLKAGSDITQKYEVIAIDEAQFFDDLLETVVDLVDKQGKRVLVAGLDADYKKQAVGQIIYLVPHCDTVTKLTPFCKMCLVREKKIVNAVFTKYIGDKMSGGDNIDIGGSDKYLPVCRECYLL